MRSFFPPRSIRDSAHMGKADSESHSQFCGVSSMKSIGSFDVELSNKADFFQSQFVIVAIPRLNVSQCPANIARFVAAFVVNAIKRVQRRWQRTNFGLDFSYKDCRRLRPSFNNSASLRAVALVSRIVRAEAALLDVVPAPIERMGIDASARMRTFSSTRSFAFNATTIITPAQRMSELARFALERESGISHGRGASRLWLGLGSASSPLSPLSAYTICAPLLTLLMTSGCETINTMEGAHRMLRALCSCKDLHEVINTPEQKAAIVSLCASVSRPLPASFTAPDSKGIH